MSNKKDILQNNLLPKIGLSVGFGIILITWIIIFLAKGFDFNIGVYHLLNPALWIIYLLPVILFFAGTSTNMVMKQFKKDVQEQLEEQISNTNRVALFADKIGNGEFEAEYELKDNNDKLGSSLLDMRDKLIANFKKESKQNWIAQGRDKISNILRMYNDVDKLTYEVLYNLIKYIDVIQGAIYLKDEDSDNLNMVASYAYNRRKYLNASFKIGEGLVGEAAIEQNTIYRTEIPSDYVTITSGILGDKKPNSLLIVPLITEEHLMGVLEFASLDEFNPTTIEFIEELSDIIARTIYNLKLNKRTEELLQESQKMTAELKENEEQLRQNAEEMRATQEELQKTNEKLEEQFQELENSQKRQHALLENASEVISIYNKDQKLVYQSPSVTRILGYTPEEMMEGKDIDRLTPKGQVEIRELFQKVLENPEEVVSIQYTYMRKDNRKIYIESTARNFLDDPAIKGIVLNSQDITERKRAEKEERMKSKMQSLSENSLDIIIRLDIRARFYYANPMVEKYTGIPKDDFYRKTVNELPLSEDYKEKWTKIVKDIKNTKERISQELTYIKGDGEERIMQVNAIPEFTDDGKLETILVVSHDITEQKIIELEIKDKNKKISDSINYAKRLQNAILPDNKIIRRHFPDSFMLYMPKDVVSGDFPWFYPKGEDLYIAAVDCTGHGVPGAMLSLIGYFVLDNIVQRDEEYNAAEVLDLLHEGVKRTLRQEEEGAEARDGMDVALCKINKKKQTIDYAGAHRPLYYLKADGSFEQIKGSPKAIGGIPRKGKPDKRFENHHIEYNFDDAIFFNSDGYPDQFGGPDNRKYGPKRIREGIKDNKEFNMMQYLSHFKREHEKWKGDERQFDDVLLMGIRLINEESENIA